ncbi:MAG: amidohydrolase family protein [Desulfurococcales archaeon]|nr:amidohydrolase family protein [Desulfurococcales archaeon]
MAGALAIEAGLALLGEELAIRRNVCVWIRDGVVESIEGASTCPPTRLGGENRLLLPQPANAHVHSGDFAFPEYGIGLNLEELVAPPRGLKHLLLARTPRDKLLAAIEAFYLWAWRVGTGLLADFREGGGEGCRVAYEASKRLPPGMEVVILGRPGPGWPGACMGLGLSSPLDVDLKQLVRLASRHRPAGAHVAETRSSREAGDLERAIQAKLDFIVHGVHLSKEDLRALGEHGIALIACPRSNAWHSLGIPPLPDAWSEGLVVGIGTDNAGWMPPDIWEEARYAALSALLRGAPRQVVARNVIEAIFVGGYKALRRTPRIVDEGVEAHMLLIAAEGRGILEALDPYWAIVKRVGADALEARIDGAAIYRLTP